MSVTEQETSSSQEDAKPKSGGVSGKWRILALCLMLGTSAALYVKYHHLLTVSSLKQNHGKIQEMVEAHPVAAPLMYIGTLIVVIGITCPGATMLSFIGGILFKQPYASLYAYIGYIIGASISFLVTTFILGDMMRQRLASKSQLFQKFEANVKRNAFVYLVAARYTLVFPFFFVNAAAALVGVKLSVFVAASSISCIPGSVIYTTAGGALANMLHKIGDNENVDKSQLVWMALSEPNVKVCLALVCVCLLVMAAVKMMSRDSEEKKK